jgi:hypothetical protein
MDQTGSGRFGGKLAGQKRPTSEPFDMSRFGTPYSEHAIENVIERVRMAPMPNMGHRKSGAGHPMFLYRPDKPLTGEDNTETALCLPEVNYGLHQRVVFQQMKERGLDDHMIPYEVMRHSQWPITVEEFLGPRQIIPMGVRDQEPNDPRGEYQAMSVPFHIEGLAHGVPWIWPALSNGDVIGFRLGEVELCDTSFVDPDGKPVGEVAKGPILQLTPMVLYTGAKYHGAGKGLKEDLGTELDFPHVFRVDQHDRAFDEFGLPLGPPIEASRGEFEYVSRGSGFFFAFGRVAAMMGKPPSTEASSRAIRTYRGMRAVLNTYNRLAVYLTPHTREDRLRR